MTSGSTPADSGCTLRGLAFGTLGCVLVGAGFQYSDMVLSVYAWSGWYYTIGANVMLFILALFVNPVLGLLRRSVIVVIEIVRQS